MQWKIGKKIVLRIGSNPIKMIVFKNISKLEPFKILHEKYEEAISNKQDSPEIISIASFDPKW